MNLKDEIEKIIQSEQQKLEARNKEKAELQECQLRNNAEHAERQRERFKPMFVLLKEIIDSVEPEYLQSTIFKDLAILKIGRTKQGYFSKDIQVRIQPNYVYTPNEDSEVSFYERPGFRVNEKYFGGKKLSLDSENMHIFATERETAEYLAKKIAQQIAFYRYLDKNPIHSSDKDYLYKEPRVSSDERIPCGDENCIGTIAESKVCNICGKPYKAT